jgi:hypothetical protein
MDATVVIEELRKADRIISVMLNAMTLKQKTVVAAKLEVEGISPDGMVRANERRAVLVTAGAL